MTAYFKGMQINISVYFASVLALLCALSKNGYASLGLVCCILHEVGHLAILKAMGGRARSISFGAYGMRIDISASQKLTPLKESLVCLGGPLINLVLIFFGMAIKNQMLINVNIALMVFNMLPIETMDGYNFLFNLIIAKGNVQKGKTALKIISAVFLTVVYAFGFLVLFKSGYNFTVLAVAVYLSVKFLSPTA